MISIRSLSKSYGRLTVFEDLDLDIEDKRVTAILGPNAAGKTTIIKCVLGLATPDKGTITVGGIPVSGGYRYRESIGYMPQNATFPDNLTGAEIIDFLISLRGETRARDLALLEAFDLGADLDKAVRSLSGGTRQKINAAITFLFTPDVLILDEPTAGLDPRSSSLLKDKILELRGQGRTVVLTSHIMSEVEELADRVVYLSGGRIAFEGEAAEMRRQTGMERLERAIAQMMDEAG